MLKHCGHTHSHMPAFVNTTYYMAWYCGHRDEWGIVLVIKDITV